MVAIMERSRSIPLVFLMFVYLCSFNLAKSMEASSIKTTKLTKPLFSSRNLSPSSSEIRSRVSHPKSSKTCGDVYECETGGIYYKPFAPISSRERCVWTVKAPRATGYNVEALHLGFKPDVDAAQVTVSCFARNTTANHFVPRNTGITTMDNCTLLVITFHSGVVTGNVTGFVLHYTALYIIGNIPLDSPSSKSYIFGPTLPYFKYPSTGAWYTATELSSFVFPPVNNVYDPMREMKVIYLKMGLEWTTCNDYLNVYVFNAASGSPWKWEFKQRICGDTESLMLTSTDLILVTFESSISNNNQGFYFTFTSCE